jgi:two-component system, OmpR family, KDP operon response regulator KdpE
MSIRVLIADTDRYLLATYKQQLSSRSFDVVTARNGLECLQWLREFMPDVLVLEPAIPWGGGDGIVTLMHEDPSLPRVSVILVLTAGCAPHVLYNIAHFPVSDYLAKPVTGYSLADRIRCALARFEADRRESDVSGGKRR